jgi:Ca2+-binding RTX toxin-like protein
VQVTVSGYTLTANVENLVLGGVGNISGSGNGASNLITGNSGNNTLSGNASNDTLDGGLGADTMFGGLGNDTYIVGQAGDLASEGGAAGTDTVLSSITYALAANVEKLTLTGSSNIDGTGNGGANTLTGNAGNNLLNGLGGVDSMFGGAGNDTYVVDTLSDVVVEGAAAGIDTVQVTVSGYTLTANVENLVLGGVGNIRRCGQRHLYRGQRRRFGVRGRFGGD